MSLWGVIGIEGVMPLAPIFGPKTLLGKGSLGGQVRPLVESFDAR